MSIKKILINVSEVANNGLVNELRITAKVHAEAISNAMNKSKAEGKIRIRIHGKDGYEYQNVDVNSELGLNAIATEEQRLHSRQQEYEQETSAFVSLVANSLSEPKKVMELPAGDWGVRCIGRHLWIYQDALYEYVGTEGGERQQLLVLEYADKERQKFERLKAKFSNEQSEQVKYERTRIPEHVRIEVWRRDQGKCAGCGSREKLEYDHIVPVSRGGSNTARNVELLCEECNRAKGDRIQ